MSRPFIPAEAEETLTFLCLACYRWGSLQAASEVGEEHRHCPACGKQTISLDASHTRRGVPTEDILRLAFDFKRHSVQWVTSVFADAVNAELGAGSAYGTLNSLMLYELEDRSPTLMFYVVRDRPDLPPSEAAAAMLANPHKRVGRRLTPMPSMTRAAALGYASERLELLHRAIILINSRHLGVEHRTWRRVVSRLGGTSLLPVRPFRWVEWKYLPMRKRARARLKLVPHEP